MKTLITKIKIGKRHYQFKNLPKTYLKIILSSLKQIEKSSITKPINVKASKAKPIKAKTNKKTVKLIKRHREKLGMSQSALANKLKMTQGNISQIETGRIGVSEDLAKRLAKILKVRYREFL